MPLAEVQTRCEKVSSQTCCGATKQGLVRWGAGGGEYNTQLFKQTYPLKTKVTAIAEFKIVPLAALLVCFKAYFSSEALINDYCKHKRPPAHTSNTETTPLIIQSWCTVSHMNTVFAWVL